MSGTIEALRRPEYTGDNRCIPCTAVNLVIAGAVAVVIGLVSPIAGGVVFAISLAAIYLRGYLVPGTPTITRRYFPDRILRLFDKDPVGGEEIGGSIEADQGADPEAVLLEAEAVEECEQEDDLCLTDWFRSAWRGRIEGLREEGTSREGLARILDVDAERLSFEEHGDAFVASVDGQRVGQWESEAAFVADVAAAGALREAYPGWGSLAVAERSRVLHGLRLFLEECPACGGTVSLDERVVESCCRSIDVVAATCEACGARLFEAEHPGG